MNPIAQAELVALLKPECFLHRSRSDDAFFVTDAPRRLAQTQLAALAKDLMLRGYLPRLTPSGLWQIDLADKRFRSIADEIKPACSLALPQEDVRMDAYALAQLLYRHPAPWETQPKEPLRALLKRYDHPAEFAACARLQLESCAALLRRHLPLPSAAATVLHAWLNELYKEGLT
ncbi:MAG: hypothetical protein LLF96_07665 [Eubacteriales bacterium]|nr:hypothetical protein [Eubacteriales bacterium]